MKKVLDITNNKNGITVWFTGLSCSGKSTIARNLEEVLKYNGVDVERIDGDTFRKTLSNDLGYSKEDRDKNIEGVVYVAEILTRHGVIVLTSFISPYREKRNWARKYIGNFMEVYVNCPLQICEQRDTRGLYAKARQGIIPNFTGISDPYGEPLNPELVLETNKESINQSTGRVLMALYKRSVIKGPICLI